MSWVSFSVYLCARAHIDYIIVYLIYTFRYTPFFIPASMHEKTKLSTQFHFPQFILFNECLSHLVWHMKQDEIEIEIEEKKCSKWFPLFFICVFCSCTLICRACHWVSTGRPMEPTHCERLSAQLNSKLVSIDSRCTFLFSAFFYYYANKCPHGF